MNDYYWSRLADAFSPLGSQGIQTRGINDQASDEVTMLKSVAGVQTRNLSAGSPTIVYTTLSCHLQQNNPPSAS